MRNSKLSDKFKDQKSELWSSLNFYMYALFVAGKLAHSCSLPISIEVVDV